MFNIDIKEKAIAGLNETIKGYEVAVEKIKELSIDLYNHRIAASTNVIQSVEDLISKLANKPKEFAKDWVRSYIHTFS